MAKILGYAIAYNIFWQFEKFGSILQKLAVGIQHIVTGSGSLL